MNCPLCGQAKISPNYSGERGHYALCPNCKLVFLDPSSHPSSAESKQRYDTHNNNPEDEGYQAFFAELVEALKSRRPPPAKVLDYGTGQGSALPPLLSALGYEVALYDPLYVPDSKVLNKTYDVVTCTETMEHFAKPGQEFEKLVKMLPSKGILAVMSLWLAKKQDFDSWWYKNDLTHISFYTEDTLSWMASNWNLHLEVLSDRLALFRKGA